MKLTEGAEEARGTFTRPRHRVTSTTVPADAYLNDANVSTQLNPLSQCYEKRYRFKLHFQYKMYLLEQEEMYAAKNYSEQLSDNERT